MGVTRFAPSLTGLAHPGTLMSALLVWLDGKHRGDKLHLRLEDLDTTRLRPHYEPQMLEALDWLGLPWDSITKQSTHSSAHHNAMDALMNKGLLYECTCSRSTMKSIGKRAPDGGWAYTNTCRHRSILKNWQNTEHTIRCRLYEHKVHPNEESTLDTSQIPADVMGDPILRRRDGIISYLFASVVDDIEIGVTRIVRGEDLAHSTATQVALYSHLDKEPPSYRHHVLLLEKRENKLSKMHGSIGFDQLRRLYSPQEFLGRLASMLGLISSFSSTSANELLKTFSWDKIVDASLYWEFPSDSPKP